MDVTYLATMLVALGQPVPQTPSDTAPAVEEAPAVADDTQPDADAPQPPTEAAEVPAATEAPDTSAPPETSPAETTGVEPSEPEPTPAEEAVEAPEAQPPAEPDPVEPSPAAYDPEPAPLEPRTRPPEPEEGAADFAAYRRGAFVSFSVGAGHCGTWCTVLSAIGGARAAVGYRWHRFALGFDLSWVGGNYTSDASDEDSIYSTIDASGSTRFFHIGPMAQFHPMLRGRFDPYVGLGFGYRRLTDRYEIDGPNGVEAKYWEYGAGVTLSAGIPIYVTERTTVGLRYDKSFAIRGQGCFTVDDETPPGEERCEAWTKGNEGQNQLSQRFRRLTRPRPWTVAFEVRVAF